MSPGRRPGTKFRKFEKRPDDPQTRLIVRLYKSEADRLARIGDGNASAGLLKLLSIAESLGL